MRPYVAPLLAALSLTAAAACALFACGAQSLDVQLANPEQPLRLARVVMYQNGLAHFERRGRSRSSTVDLRVPSAQVDDVLRSLTVVDGGEAAITGVRMLPSEQGSDVTLRVGLSADDGARDLRISYVTELPGFRPTYRLVVQGDDQVHVQGLAVVDNATGEAWEDVALTLSTEVPLSFQFDLRQARRPLRPRFGGDGHLVVDNPRFAQVNLRGAHNPTEVNVAYGMAQAGQPEMSNRAGELVDNPHDGQAPPADPAQGDRSQALLAFEQRPEAEEGVFAEMRGFDLGRGESGLVPFVDTRTAGRMALLFKPSPGGRLSATHPYRAVMFRNPSEAPLLTGPVSIFAGDRFVGDGVTGTVAARAHAFVPYGLERGVTVEQEASEVEDEVRALALAGGQLTVELRAVARQRFVVESRRPVDRPMYVFAARRDGYEPRELPGDAIRSPGGYFLPVAVEGGRAEIVFEQVLRRTTEVNVASDPDELYVGALLSLLEPTREVETLRSILDRLTAIEEELDTHAEDLQVERAALAERREALDALREVGGAGAVRQELSRGVAQSVSRVDAITRRASALHAEQISLEQRWYAQLRALTVAPR